MVFYAGKLEENQNANDNTSTALKCQIYLVIRENKKIFDQHTPHERKQQTKKPKWWSQRMENEKEKTRRLSSKLLPKFLKGK